MQITKDLDINSIEIKKFISFVEKQLLIDTVVGMCLEEDFNGLLKCDFFNKKLATDTEIILFYTNLEFNEQEFIEQYDWLIQNEVLGYVLGQINESELDTIYDAIGFEIRERQNLGNSIEGILASKLQLLMDKIPSDKQLKKLMNEVPKMLNKVKPENMEILKGIMNKQVV